MIEMTFFEDCLHYFGTNSLYEILNISKAAKPTEVKKAYYNASLKIHPDRVSHDKKDEATRKFQILLKVYYILSNKEKKKIYDESGEVEDEINERIVNWREYWNVLFKPVTKKEFDDFYKKYKGKKIFVIISIDNIVGSNEEIADLKKIYEQHKGDMNAIMECHMCTSYTDEARLRELIQNMINKKEVKAYKAFTHESDAKKKQRTKKWEKEAKETEASAQHLGVETEKGLVEFIQTRRNALNDFVDQLEVKYAKTKNLKAKKKEINTKKNKNMNESNAVLKSSSSHMDSTFIIKEPNKRTRSTKQSQLKISDETHDIKSATYKSRNIRKAQNKVETIVECKEDKDLDNLKKNSNSNTKMLKHKVPILKVTNIKKSIKTNVNEFDGIIETKTKRIRKNKT